MFDAKSLLEALVTGGALSLFASANPDGLEWAMERVAGTAELESESNVHDKASDLQDKVALMPDYDFVSADDAEAAGGTTVAGIVGSAATFALAGAAGLGITAIRARRRKTEG